MQYSTACTAVINTIDYFRLLIVLDGVINQVKSYSTLMAKVNIIFKSTFFREHKTKRYFIIYQQIARCLYTSVKVFTTSFPSMQLKYFPLFLLQGSQPIMIKGSDFRQ